MKKFTRIFTLVAALFAFACTTDATKDLGVTIGDQTTLTLSLEESRTQLGEAANGLYPVTWCEGDKISVNGIESSSIAITDNASVANFTFDSTLAYPYGIAYPAAPAGKVVFAKEQPQSYGTFANGAATMYGYAEAEGGMTLKHLTGVLKIGVKGPGAITRVEISTLDRKPISGEFNINFATGEITPTEASEYTVGCSFEESADGDAGLDLSDDVQYFYFAVPAGEYNELYVTLQNGSGEAMFATVKADNTKPLVAGIVREFSNTINYAPSNIFVISDVASLKSFASEAVSLQKDAVVVADIDMTGESWTPIGNFAGRFLGNGHAIKGLSAPLFGTSNVAEIKGVHLVDINMTITKQPDAGALICDITNANAKISHCSVTGNMTINVNKIAVNHSNNYYGAMVGFAATSEEFHDLYTNVDITTAEKCISKNHMYISHLVGRGGTTPELAPSLRNVVCHGTITHNGSTPSGKYLYTGGIATTYISKAINCVIGKSDDDGTAGSIFVGSRQTAAVYHGGMITFLNTMSDLENCHNYSNVTISSTSGHIHAGGLVHSTRGGKLTDCNHYGKITITSNDSTRDYYAGGIVSSDSGGSANQVNTFTRCNNYGDIEFPTGSASSAYNVGGLMARRETKGNSAIFDSCNNYGDIIIKGKIINNSHIGGLVGLAGAGTADKPLLFSLKNCTNYGDVTIESQLALVKSGSLRVGGAFGTVVFPIEDTEGYIRNEGKVTCSFDNSSAAESMVLGIGGLVGFSSDDRGNLNLTKLKLENYGDVEVKFVNGSNFTYPTRGGIGGIIGVIGENVSISNVTCRCNVVALGLTGRAGLITGQSHRDTRKATNCQLGGSISFSEEATENIDGNTIMKPVTNVLDELNYCDYLYSAPINKAVAEADKITLLPQAE